MKPRCLLLCMSCAVGVFAATAAGAAPVLVTPSALAFPTVLFDNGNVDGRMAAASRPSSAGGFEIESADDFVLGSRTLIDGASFTGLLPTGTSLSSVSEVRVEIYRVFPKDSADPPSGRVPTRVNSPSDVAFDERDSAGSTLSYAVALLAGSFTALNSVQPGGIHAIPNQTTGGDGAVTGEEVRFDVQFATPFDLPADHYFFVPQVALAGAGDFLWLSSVRPIVAPGTPFTPDLQAWTRDALLDPDWLRVGTDIVGGAPAPTFNLAFSLTGQQVTAVPEPASLALATAALAALGAVRRRPRR